MTLPYTPSSIKTDILSVSQFVQNTKSLLETAFPNLWIEGEISNLIQHTSGHWYFHLKDKQSQIRCAMFKGQNSRVNFSPKHGQQIIIRAQATVYPAKGDFQLIVQSMKQAGEGELQQAFEELKQKLLKEGLFETSQKKSLPTFPLCIGVMTSPSGAVIQDICTVLKRRCPLIRIIILPTAVQGLAAVPDLLKQFSFVTQAAHVFDLIVLARGGGSLEDLQAFNNELIARAIAACPVPIISSIGHETDTTIADLVSDCRAATPSVAAEILSTDQADWLLKLKQYQTQLQLCMSHQYEQAQSYLNLLYKSLPHPLDRLREQTQKLDHTLLQFQHAYEKLRITNQTQINTYRYKLQKLAPTHTLKQSYLALNHVMQRLVQAIDQKRLQANQALIILNQPLQAYNPTSLLKKGYSLIQNDTLQIIKSCRQVQINDKIKIQVGDGTLIAQIIDIQEKR